MKHTAIMSAYQRAPCVVWAMFVLYMAMYVCGIIYDVAKLKAL